ncbi:hypothetical protein [Polymorphum gilvum]|uniref:Transmembrane protein n=1 Tax=Polymorphum gilvum (strain LMG 25793 / CGMCC 1.9160 / SL003B-26A1) TaxID=991905 RepID=F2J653_POLGS|nr:hypothetical protein [Polymorphum gilvum]ADZ72417.1 hypothetical protein SL003B_3997 [Polymorphum gilvum SL003B-26A1]
MSWLLSLVLRLASSGLVERTLAYLERRAASETDRAALRTQVEIEAIRAAVAETREMTAFNGAKLEHAAFWIFAALFVLPLGLWWGAVCLDSVFRFGWRVATVPILEAWGGQMIQWLFYVGGGVAALRSLR